MSEQNENEKDIDYLKSRVWHYIHDNPASSPNYIATRLHLKEKVTLNIINKLHQDGYLTSIMAPLKDANKFNSIVYSVTSKKFAEN